MDESRNNLPHQMTSFVGREAELDALYDLLGPAGEWRLATVTGAGGIGKTRVALEVARRLLPHFRHGIRLLELAPIARADAISLELLGVFGLAERPGESQEQTLYTYLRERQLLLLLDNCEHLLAGAAHVVERLLAACPQVRVLATSRRPLGLRGELRWHLQPMRTPGPSTPTQTSPDAALEFEAVRLFYERARAARPTFTLSPDNVAAVAAICRRLDGMPLAIELVAPLVNSFTPQDLAAQLDQRLHMHTAGHTIHPRHRTLHATAAWSYQLLTQAEQALFRQLAIFVGGWSGAAAEAVCAPPRPNEASIAALSARLVDGSLVAVEEHGSEMRYRLLATLRDYAQDRLRTTGEADALAERHARYFRQFAAEAAAGLRTRASPTWMQRLDAEFDNLRAACEWLLEHDAPAAAGLSADLLWYCVWRRRYAEGRALLERALAHPRVAEAPRDQVRAMAALATLLVWEVAPEAAFAWARRCLDAAQLLPLSAERDAVMIDAWMAYVSAAVSFRPQEALQYLTNVEALPRAQADPWLMGWVSIGRVTAHQALGNVAESIRAGHESVAAFRAAGEPFGLSVPLYALGRIHFSSGEYGAARDAFAECRELSARLDNLSILVACHFRLAETAQALGDSAQALGSFRQGLALLQRAGDRPTGEHLAVLASMAADARLWETAALLFGAAQAGAPPWFDVIRRSYARQIERAQERLGNGTFARLEAEGAALSVDEGLARGLRRLEQIAAGEATRLPAVAVAVLGPAEVRVDGVLLAAAQWTYRRARELLLLLACFGPLTRGQIGLALWPDASPIQLRNNLGVAVFHLRRALGNQETVIFDGERYTINPSLTWWVDLAEFRRLLTEADIAAEQGAPQRAPPRDAKVRALEQAAALVRGELLQDQSDGEWFDTLRGEVLRLELDVLVRLGEEYSAADRCREALEVLERALALDALHEEAHRAIMACYIAHGQAGRAVAHYLRLAEQMRTELGAQPDAATQALYRQAQRMAGTG